VNFPLRHAVIDGCNSMQIGAERDMSKEKGEMNDSFHQYSD
jgi:hypothetical protein